MFAGWAGWVKLTTRLAPLARDGAVGLEAAKAGLKGRLVQPVTPKALDADAGAPWIAFSSESVLSRPQLGGLNRKLGFLTLTLSGPRCSPPPPTIPRRVAGARTPPQ